MSVIVHGVGGTGKAVVNLLQFAIEVAQTCEHKAPQLSFAIVDQDPSGRWPNTSFSRPAKADSGTLAQLLGINEPRQRVAASAYYTGEELDTDISRGFHEQARLAAAVIEASDGIQVGSQSVQIVVYSDIGGTGAGAGPHLVRRLLGDANTRHVIAIVYGKYIDHGPAVSVGYEWLRQARLAADRDRRWFTAFYVNVPAHHPHLTQPPPTGLNETPALLLGAAAVWNLAQAENDGVLENALATNARGNAREDVREVGFSSWGALGDLLGGDGEIARCRAAARNHNLLQLLPRSDAYRAHNVAALINFDDLHQACWRVFEADETAGTASDLAINYGVAFEESFGGVPVSTAARDWFHTAVIREPLGEAAELFRRLVALYLHRGVHVVPLLWSPRREDRTLYALSVRSQRELESDWTAAESAIVGFFSDVTPPWTTKEFVANLQQVKCDEFIRSDQITIRLDPHSRLGETVEAVGGSQTLPASTRNQLTVELRTTTATLRDWSWDYHFEAAGWSAQSSLIDRWRSLGTRLEVHDGGVTFPGTSGGYQCRIRGLQLREPVIADRDHIGFGGVKGDRWYVVESHGIGSRQVSLMRRISPVETISVRGDDAVLQVGNITIETHGVLS